jgi:hypothetical protein
MGEATTYEKKHHNNIVCIHCAIADTQNKLYVSASSLQQRKRGGGK